MAFARVLSSIWLCRTARATTFICRPSSSTAIWTSPSRSAKPGCRRTWTAGSPKRSRARELRPQQISHRLRPDPAPAVSGGARFDRGSGRSDRQLLVCGGRLLRAVSTRLPGRNHDAGPAHLRHDRPAAQPLLPCPRNRSRRRGRRLLGGHPLRLLLLPRAVHGSRRFHLLGHLLHCPGSPVAGGTGSKAPELVVADHVDVLPDDGRGVPAHELVFTDVRPPIWSSRWAAGLEQQPSFCITPRLSRQQRWLACSPFWLK